MNKNNKGFSFVELLIILSIMGILASMTGPSLIKYIDRSRKAMDIESASVIFRAAQLASASSSDEAVFGWTLVADRKYTTPKGVKGTLSTGSVAQNVVTATGHLKSLDRAYTGPTYKISVVSFARGLKYNNWENVGFKAILDKNGTELAGFEKKANGKNKTINDVTMAWSNEFLRNMLHEDYVNEVWKGDGKNLYDGPVAAKNMIKFKYTKDAGYGIAECWLICIRNDNYNCEIWIGDKNLNGRGAKQPVRPLYRIYPEPCNEYRN